MNREAGAQIVLPRMIRQGFVCRDSSPAFCKFARSYSRLRGGTDSPTPTCLQRCRILWTGHLSAVRDRRDRNHKGLIVVPGRNRRMSRKPEERLAADTRGHEVAIHNGAVCTGALCDGGGAVSRIRQSEWLRASFLAPPANRETNMTVRGCCESNANLSPLNAPWARWSNLSRRATATQPGRLSVGPCSRLG